MGSNIRYIAAAITILACLSTPSWAEIFKTVDQYGNVTYTDVPPKKEQAGESVVLKSGNTYSAPEPETPVVKLSPEPDEVSEEIDFEAEIYQYNQLLITWPTNDLDVRENAGNVQVSVAVDPYFDVASGHSIQVLLDGAIQSGISSGTNVALANVDRGTHSLQAQIVDSAGNVLISSSSIIFHLKRHSALF